MSFTREDIDLEAIRARIAGMSDSLKYGQSAVWMAEHSDRATWRDSARRRLGNWPVSDKGNKTALS
jgi:hypothetical protein